MKYLISVLIIGIFTFQNTANANRNCNYLNFVVLIDGEVLSYFNGQIVINHKNLRESDTIPFQGRAGTISFDSLNYHTIINLPKNEDVEIHFVGSSIINGELISKKYKYSILAKWLNYGFIVFKVYNFDNPKNWAEFYQREGYDIEFQASEYRRQIPRKKK